MSLSFKMIGATDVGQVRAANEDSLRILPTINIAVVADGMGGHKAGDIASRMAVNALCEHFEEQALIQNQIGGASSLQAMSDAFTLANSQVYANAQSLANCEGMGTTLVACTFDDEQIHVGHIGDSRLYRFEHGKIEQITTDHTLATELSIDAPDRELPAYSHHVLRKALGIESSCSPDIFSIEPKAGQIYLMCSDGLTGVVSDNDLSTILSLRSHQPEHCIETMIDACLENGAPDNVSIILVFVENS